MIVVDVNRFDARSYALAGFRLDNVTRWAVIGSTASDSCSVLQRFGLWDLQNNMVWLKIAFRNDDEPVLELKGIAAQQRLLDEAEVVVAIWDVEFQKVLKMKTSNYCLPRSMKTHLYRRFKFDLTSQNNNSAIFDFV